MKPGKRRRTGERHAQIPLAVQTSAAYRAAPDYAVRVLARLAANYYGTNNGSLSLSIKDAEQCGVITGKNRWALYAGLRVLQDTGLILCTFRIDKVNPYKLKNLYALTWRPIDDCTYQHGYRPGIVAGGHTPNMWRHWVEPPDWKRQEQRIRYAAQGKQPRTQKDAARFRARLPDNVTRIRDRKH